MKNLRCLPIAIFLATTLHAQRDRSVPEHGPKLSFDKEVHDYDTIPQYGDGRCEFLLTNVGDEPLIIHRFSSSCGCLVPSWDMEPVLPGQSTRLKARYDTGRIGPINKSLTVTTNAVDRPVVVLRIKGVVRPLPPNAPVPSAK